MTTQTFLDMVPGLLGAQILGGERGALLERVRGDDALHEDLPQRRHGFGQVRLAAGVGPHAFDEADPVHQLAQLGGGERSDDIGPEHLATEGQMDFQHLGPEHRCGDAGIDRRRVVREPDGTAKALTEVRDEIHADPLGRARVHRGALHHRERHAARLDTSRRCRDLVLLAHARREHDRDAAVAHPIEQRVVVDLAGSDLPARHADALEQLDRCKREGRTQEEEVSLLGVLAQLVPALFGELHAAPVAKTRRVLRAEGFAPRLGRCALGARDVGLELDGVGARSGGGVDEGVGHPEAALVALGDLGNHGAGRAGARLIQPGSGAKRLAHAWAPAAAARGAAASSSAGFRVATPSAT